MNHAVYKVRRIPQKLDQSDLGMQRAFKLITGRNHSQKRVEMKGKMLTKHLWLRYPEKIAEKMLDPKFIKLRGTCDFEDFVRTMNETIGRKVEQ